MKAIEEKNVTFLMEVRDKAFPVCLELPQLSFDLGLRVASCFYKVLEERLLWCMPFAQEIRTSPLFYLALSLAGLIIWRIPTFANHKPKHI